MKAWKARPLESSLSRIPCWLSKSSWAQCWVRVETIAKFILPVVLKEMSCLLWWPSFQWMNLNQWMVSGHVAQWPADDLNMDKQKRGTYTSPQRTALITSPHLSVIFACWFQSCNVWVTSENVTMACFHDSCRTFYMNLHDDVSA